MKAGTALKKIFSASLLVAGLPFLLAAKTDKIDLPFVNDSAVLGNWLTIAYADSIGQFSPGEISGADSLFFKNLEFLPGGRMNGEMQSGWTNGVVISTYAKTASKYTIKKLDGTDYMFFEWKAGDYILRDMDPGYYVLVREADYPKVKAAARPEETEDLGQAADCLTPADKPGICRNPEPQSFEKEPVTVLPAYDPDSGKMWQLDLRGRDISGLDLTGRAADLMYAEFDSETKFPKVMPEGFDPVKILETGKNPGFGLRALHAKGLTGKGVAIGIIDQPLLSTHKEYAAALKSYEEIHVFGKNRPASMHGPAVASLAVGKTCGVAPDAELYYIATDFYDSAQALDFKYLAAAVDRLADISAALPKEKKIRVISISRGFGIDEKGAKELLASIYRAGKNGIMVLTTSPEVYYDFDFMGLGKHPAADPDNSRSYGPGLFWQKNFFRSKNWIMGKQLLAPMDSRTTASPTGDGDYVFYPNGGLSWTVPYIAGLYALACQADPQITPEAFFSKAMRTSTVNKIEKDGTKYELPGLVNPAALLGSGK